VPFAFTGKIDKLTFNMGKPQMMAADKKAQADAVVRAD
jgi:polyisoprenoid-binding protein YceI